MCVSVGRSRRSGSLGKVNTLHFDFSLGFQNKTQSDPYFKGIVGLPIVWQSPTPFALCLIHWIGSTDKPWCCDILC